MELRAFWVWASRWPRAPWRELAARVGGWDELIDSGEAALRALGFSDDAVRGRSAARGVVVSGWVITMSDPDYPPALHRLEQPPPVIFGEGERGALRERFWAVVGTRRASIHGAAKARGTVELLQSAGVGLISGLARGIDGHAHRAALGGVNIAVLGHGLGHTSPASHRGLRRELLEQGGTVLSTWLSDTPAAAYRFPIRNELVAAMAEAVVIVEAPIKSGALITARLAAESGRRVFAYLGEGPEHLLQGCRRAVAWGAEPLIAPRDLRSYLNLRASHGDPEWLSDLRMGHPLEDVALRHGMPLAELLVEATRLELDGVLVRLHGAVYAPGGST